MFTLACPPEQSRGYRVPNGAFTNGQVILNSANCIAFASSEFPDSVPDDAKVLAVSISKITQAPANMIISADEIEADVKIGENFTGGQIVYAEISGGVPTGLVVNEAGSANRIIGYAKRDVPISTAVQKMIIVNFDGRPVI